MKSGTQTPVPGQQSADGATVIEVLDAVVIGAGFSGLYMLLRLRDHLGLKVRVYEAGEDVGGTWYWSTYPGARCDTESYVYCYSFSRELREEWNWSGRYPEQQELLAYLHHVADRFNLRPDIRLSTSVTRATFDEQTHRWLVEADTGERVYAQYLITGIGLLASAPYLPRIEGLDDFAGELYHTGRWPDHPVDFSGKRVGVIGTGSTGVQAIPVIARTAKEVWVFQRSAQFAVPGRPEQVDRAYLDNVKANYDEIWQRTHGSLGGFPWEHNGRLALEDSPEQRRAIFDELWADGGFKFLFGSYKDLLTDRRSNDFAAEYVRERIRERIADPKLAEQLLPCDHPFGSRRLIVETNYYDIYNLPHVHLVDVRHSPIERLTASGIQTTNGEFPLDIIVLATGYDAVTGPFLRFDIRGKGGAKLADKWRSGPSTFLGVAMSDFPNLLMITGPGSTFGNLAVAIEHSVEWIGELIAYMRERGYASVEADAAAEKKWMTDILARADRTLTSLADSWLTGSNVPGKPRQALIDFGSSSNYRRTCAEIAQEGYPGLCFVDAGEPVKSAATGTG